MESLGSKNEIPFLRSNDKLSIPIINGIICFSGHFSIENLSCIIHKLQPECGNYHNINKID
jgi:hypothetical protein